MLISGFFSYRLRWLGDDIFIGLRYVENFCNGNGMVFNIGEKVEGYTDFLWLMFLSVFACLKFNVPLIAEIAGVFFSLGTLVIFSVIGYKVSSEKKRVLFPFITFALATNYDYNTWATGGLEVAFFSFLLSVSFYIYFFSRLLPAFRLLFTGLFLCLAALTRPDTLLIIASANLLFVFGMLSGKEKLQIIFKRVFQFNLAFILIYIPYFIWRFNYYGFLFPNTYYDKLADETFFSKGFHYIYLYFKAHFTSLLIFFIPCYLFIHLLKRRELKQFIFKKENAAFITCLFLLFIYLVFFVAKVGGDFMYARFIIPCVPFICFSIFYFICSLNTKYVNVLLFSFLLLCFTETYFRLRLFNQLKEESGINSLIIDDVADERYCYTTCVDVGRERKRGEEFKKYFKDIKVRALVGGTQARFAYYVDFYYCQEYFGLTDTLIAHSKVTERGRIGHEKGATMEHLENKNVHFSFDCGRLKSDFYRFAKFYLPSDSMDAEIITYHTSIINEISSRLGNKFKYISFPDYLDKYINDTLPFINSYQKLSKTYSDFYSYYFKNNDDKKRATSFTLALGKLKKD